MAFEFRDTRTLGNHCMKYTPQQTVETATAFLFKNWAWHYEYNEILSHAWEMVERYKHKKISLAYIILAVRTLLYREYLNDRVCGLFNKRTTTKGGAHELKRNIGRTQMHDKFRGDEGMASNIPDKQSNMDLLDFVNVLDKLEAKILTMTLQGYTLDEIGKDMGKHRQWICRIKLRAINQLSVRVKMEGLELSSFM